MKYLFAGQQSHERVTHLLALTSIRSQNIRKAIYKHLVDGLELETAAFMADVPSSNLKRAIDAVEEVAVTVEAIKELDFKRVK